MYTHPSTSSSNITFAAKLSLTQTDLVTPSSVLPLYLTLHATVAYASHTARRICDGGVSPSACPLKSGIRDVPNK